MRGIILEVTRTFHQERMRAKKLLAKAADALVRGVALLTNDVRVQDELDMLQQHETIPYVDIDYIKEANRVLTIQACSRSEFT